jgi:hypothetical protein
MTLFLRAPDYGRAAAMFSDAVSHTLRPGASRRPDTTRSVAMNKQKIRFSPSGKRNPSRKPAHAVTQRSAIAIGRFTTS